MKRILIVLTIGVYLIAIGALGMAYYQRLADSGFFITPPMAPQQEFVQPHSHSY